MTLHVVTIAGLAVLAALIWILLRMRAKDLIEEKMAKRRESARFVSRADFVEGLERIPVALALMNDSIVIPPVPVAWKTRQSKRSSRVRVTI